MGEVAGTQVTREERKVSDRSVASSQQLPQFLFCRPRLPDPVALSPSEMTRDHSVVSNFARLRHVANQRPPTTPCSTLSIQS
jgi:hypothetical protein